MEANPLRNLNSFNHFFKPIAASKFLEGFRRERIEADVDTPQTCGIQVCRLLGKQDAVCRESDVLDSRNRCEFRHEVMKRPPNQRLTASQTQFFDPQWDRDSHEPFDFLKCQQFGLIHELHIFRGHAVEAANIAAICDADAEIVMKATEGIDQRKQRVAHINTPPG